MEYDYSSLSGNDFNERIEREKIMLYFDEMSAKLRSETLHKWKYETLYEAMEVLKKLLGHYEKTYPLMSLEKFDEEIADCIAVLEKARSKCAIWSALRKLETYIIEHELKKEPKNVE